MSIYHALIVELSGATPAEAPVVEQYIRGTYHTLDHLSRGEFKREAKLCLAAVHADPALAASVAKDLFPCGCRSCKGGVPRETNPGIQAAAPSEYNSKLKGTAKVVPFECAQCGQWHSDEALRRSKGQCPTKGGEAYPTTEVAEPS